MDITTVSMDTKPKKSGYNLKKELLTRREEEKKNKLKSNSILNRNVLNLDADTQKFTSMKLTGASYLKRATK